MPIKVTPSLQKALYACCEKSKGTHDECKGILYRNGKVFATDTYNLILLSGGVLYDPIYEGKIVDRNGEFIDLQPMEYEKAIPHADGLYRAPGGTVADLRKVLAGIDKKTDTIRMGEEFFLKTDSLRRIFKVFAELEQTPVLYFNRTLGGTVKFQSENCIALSMPIEPYRPNLAYAENSCYDYELLGI